MLKLKPKGHFGCPGFCTFRIKNYMKICDLSFYLMSHHHLNRRRLQNCRNKREMLQPIKKDFFSNQNGMLRHSFRPLGGE